jgi:hypothetical protein
MTIPRNKNITKQLNTYSYVIAITLQDLLQRNKHTLDGIIWERFGLLVFLTSHVPNTWSFVVIDLRLEYYLHPKSLRLFGPLIMKTCNLHHNVNEPLSTTSVRIMLLTYTGSIILYKEIEKNIVFRWVNGENLMDHNEMGTLTS